MADRPADPQVAEVAKQFAARAYKRAAGMIKQYLGDEEAASGRQESRHYSDFYFSIDFSPLHNLMEIPPEIIKCKSLRVIDISNTQITNLSPLHGLPSLSMIVFNRSPINNLAQMAPLRALTVLRGRQSAITSLKPLRKLHRLKILDISGTGIDDLSSISDLSELVHLDISGTSASDLSPISKLEGLQELYLNGTPVHDISPLRPFLPLRFLMLNRTQVDDLTPLANQLSLMYAARPGHGITGLSYTRTPIAKIKPFSDFVKLPNPGRTVETVAYVREKAGLGKHFPPGYVRISVAEELVSTSSLEPIENVPAALDFELSSTGQIVLTESASNLPLFPKRGSKKDHAERLEVCSTLADDLIADLETNNYQARSDYLQSLRKYGQRLPKSPNKGNILLADAEARSLRSMFGADVEILAPGFAAKLKTLLEQHIGLRVFYPGLTEFYRDVQRGRIDATLPLDAIDGILTTVKKATPEIFDVSVSQALRVLGTFQ